MATSKTTRATQDRGSAQVGLLANGSSGSWEVAIDEAIAGPDHWYAQLEGPSASFYFEIPALDMVDKLLRFLEPAPVTAETSSVESDEGHGTLVIGHNNKSPITLVRDNEYRDRFFLVVGFMENPMVRFVLLGQDAEQIAAALRQVGEDLEDAD